MASSTVAVSVAVSTNPRPQCHSPGALHLFSSPRPLFMAARLCSRAFTNVRRSNHAQGQGMLPIASSESAPQRRNWLARYSLAGATVTRIATSAKPPHAVASPKANP